MLIYYLLFFWSILSGSLFFFRNDKFIKKVYLLVNFLPLTFLVGFRNDYNGRDTLMYIGIFKDISETDFSMYILGNYDSRLEYGYSLLNYGISVLTTNEEVFFLCVSAVTFYCMGWFFYKNSVSLMMTLIIYYATCMAFEPMNTMRQMLALSISLCGYQFMKFKNMKMFILSICFASLFHISSILFMVFALIKHPENIKRRSILSSFIWISVFLLLIGGGLEIILSYIPHYEFYLNSKYMGGGVEQNISIESAAIRNVLLYILPVIVMMFGIKYNLYNETEKIDVYYCSICSFLVFVLNLAGYCSAVFLRVSMIFDFFVCISIPLVLKIIKDPWRIFGNALLIVLWIAYFIIKINVLGNADHIQKYVIF